MKSFLQNNATEIDSTYNEGKPVVAEKFIRALKNKIYKYMTSEDDYQKMFILIN